MCRGERFRLYLARSEIQARVRALGRRIARDYEGKKPILIGILNGAYVFMADLMRAIDIECEADFMKLSSYGDSKVSSGDVEQLKKIDADLEGRHVIVVEDIVDTGLSMEFIMDRMKEGNPASLAVATMLHKEEATQVDLELKYVGFTIEDLFVIGYGMDFGQLARNFPDIYILDE